MSSPPFIGIHLTPKRLEAIAFDATGGDFDAFHSLALPEGLIADDGVVVDPEKLSEQLQKLWSTAGFKPRHVHLAVQIDCAVSYLLVMPRLPANQIGQVILSEAEQFAVFRAEEIVIDYQVLNLSDGTMTVWYMAASRRVLQGYQQALQGAGLTLHGIETSQIAGLRGIQHSVSADIRNWSSFQIYPNKAQYALWKNGELSALRELSLPRHKDTDTDLLVEFLLAEFERMHANADLTDLPALIVSAETLASSNNLSSILGMAYQWEVAVPGADEWANRLSSAHLDSISHAGIGSGLWGHGNNLPNFDLLKNVEKRRLSLQKIDLKALLRNQETLIGLALVLAVGIAQASISLTTIFNLQKHGDSLKQTLQLHTSERDQVRQAISLHPFPEEKLIEAWTPLQSENQFIYGFLGHARNLMPSTAWLNTLRYEGSSATGSSLILDGGTTEQAAALYFANQISSLDEVRYVQLSRISLEGNAYAFSLRIGLQKPKKRELY